MDKIAIQEHFKLKRDPFGQLQKRREIYRTKKYRRQLEQIKQWVEAGEMCAVLGDIGCGKTTLIADFIQESLGKGELDIVAVGHPHRERMKFSTIYESIAEHYRMTGHVECRLPQSAQMRFLWLKSLLGETLKDRRVAIVIDEAHRLPGPFLKGLKELTDLGFGLRRSLLGIIFVGHPYFKPSVRKFAPDVYKRLLVGKKIIDDVGAMQIDEVAGYLRHRTGASGNKSIFHRGAAVVIARCSETVLDINRFAWEGMEVGYKAGSSQVKAAHILNGLTIREKVSMIKMSQNALAEIAGVSKGTVSSALKGTYTGDTGAVEKKLNEALDRIIKDPKSDLDGKYPMQGVATPAATKRSA